MISALHAVLAVAAWLLLLRGVTRPVFVEHAPDPEVASAFALAVLIVGGAGSVAAVLAGRTVWSPAGALLADSVSLAAASWAIAVVSLGPWTRDLGGVVVVAIVAVRLAPGVLAIVRDRAPSWLALVAAFGGYAALAAWLPAASLPLGDQVHYLLVTDGLRHGTLDATIDIRLFSEMLGVAPSPTDTATHVAQTPLGPRPIQGYALPALLVPGWALAGRVGAGIVLAAVAAWTSYQMLLILRDVAGALAPRRSPRTVGWTWLIASACAPLSLLATHVYPNILGAALIATAYRTGFTAPARRPALAAALLGLTLFLTPRDAVALAVLFAFLVLREPAARRRVVAAVGAVALGAVVANALLYGIPIPYAGYAFGTAQAQEVTREPSITLSVWVTLPAILFDRTFGLAGSAPWVFVGFAGLVPALRLDRARLLPAAATVGASVLALSFFRLWEGGYAPPARYFVDVLPLWAPFVAYGLGVAVGGHQGAFWATTAPSWAVRAVVAVLVGLSALTSLVLNGVPSLALNTAFDDKIRDALGRILGLDPLAWLPSFQPVVPNWYVIAYVALLPALAGAAWLLWLGTASSPTTSSDDSSEAGGDERTHALPHQIDAVPHQIDQRPRVDQRPRALMNRSGSDLNRNGSQTDAAAGQASGRRWQAAAWARGVAKAERDLLIFLVVNLALIAWGAAATLQPWVALGGDPVHESLLRKWLPLSLALAAIGTAVVARGLPPSARPRILTRHFFLYLIPLALMLVAHFGGPGVVNGQLGAVYLLIAVAFAVHALAALWRGADRMSDRAAALQLAGVALLVMIVLLPYHRAVMPTASDEPHYLIVTQSLLYDRDLDVRNDYEGDRYSAFYPARLPDMHAVEVGGAVFSIRDLGLPLLSVAPYAAAGRLGVLAFMSLVGAALVWQLYLLLRDLRFAPRVALLATATTALVHPLLTYTTQVYPELLAALAFVAAVRALHRGERSTVRDLAVASALTGTLPWLSTRAWPIAVGVGAVIAWSALRPWWRDRSVPAVVPRALAVALPFAALALALGFVNWRTFGLFLPSAGYFLIREQQPVLVYTAWIGGPGLLFDRVFGLVPRAPVYMLAFAGAAALWRRARGGHGVELVTLAAGALLSFIYIADIVYWWADGSPPSRYLIGSLPLLVAAVAGGWEVVLAAGRWARALAWLAAVASAAVAYVYAVLPNLRYDLALEVRASGSSGGLFTFLARASGVDPGQLFPSLVRMDALSVAFVVGWLAVAVVLAAVPWRVIGGAQPRKP